MFQILVADDDKNTRRLLQAVLEHDGYRVFTAENGEDALAVLDDQHITLIGNGNRIEGRQLELW